VNAKSQTSAQRIANPVWLREQIGQLLQDCYRNIEEDEELAERTGDAAKRDKYLARVESHHHWARQLKRVLRGKTSAEVLEEHLSQP
jgi:hypothetical protein